MLEQVIDAVITILGIWLLGTGAFIALIGWGSWYSKEFTETQKSKTYITIIVLGLAIYIAFF